MAKTLTKARLAKKRSLKRNKRGGEIINSLAQIKTNNNFILGEIARVQANGDCDLSQIKEIAEEEKKVIENEIDEQLAKQEKQESEPVQNEELPREEESPKEEPVSPNDEASGISSLVEEKKETPIMQQMITLNGFTGTVGELLSKLREKVKQLRRDTANKYKPYADKLSKVVKKISDDTATNIDKIKQILRDEQLTFKNNKLFGGKTKKRRNNKKSNRMTKRR